MKKYLYTHSKILTSIFMIFLLVILNLFTFTNPHNVFAACPPDCDVKTGTGDGYGTGTGTGDDVTLDFELNNPLAGSGVNTLNEFVRKLLEILLKIGVPVVAVFIILAGFKFVTARGNQAEITKAKDNLIYVMVGAAILLGAWVLANALGQTVNELTTP